MTHRKHPLHVLAALALSAVVTLGLVGCGDEEALPPEFVSFELSASSVEAGGTITATVEIMHFTFGGDHEHESLDQVPKHGETEGHVHVYLDDLMTNPVAMVGMHMFDIEIPAETEAGSHTLIARLHGHDHMIIKPEVTMEASLEVTEVSTQ